MAVNTQCLQFTANKHCSSSSFGVGPLSCWAKGKGGGFWSTEAHCSTSASKYKNIKMKIFIRCLFLGFQPCIARVLLKIWTRSSIKCLRLRLRPLRCSWDTDALKRGAFFCLSFIYLENWSSNPPPTWRVCCWGREEVWSRIWKHLDERRQIVQGFMRLILLGRVCEQFRMCKPD